MSGETETETKQNTVKSPNAFKKPVKKNKFDKKYAKYIEHPQDKQFLYSCFELQDDNYIIRSDLSKDDVKKLKNLLKIISSNKKGPVKFVPIIFAASVTAAVILFFTVFANPLLERALEMGLEAAFGARSNVSSLRLSVIPLRIYIGGITVANRDKPMTNLFQMGKTEIRLRTQAVLRGKIYIEEIRADSIRFGTERKASGSLPGKPPREKKAEKPKSDDPPLIDLKNFDAMALLNQEFDKLKTPKLYDEAINAYNETQAKWKGQVESATAKVQDLRKTTQPLLSLNVNNLRDVESIRSTVQTVNTAITSVQSATGEITAIANSLESDVNRARSLESNARNSITSDINLLKSYIDIGSGAAFAAVEPFIRDALSGAANQYLDYGIMALDVLEEVKASSSSRPKNEKPKKEPKVVFKGRDVSFPVVAYPAFYLGVFASDFTIDTWNWAFDLRDISSSPDLTNKPVKLTLGVKDVNNLQKNVSFNGNADFRTNAKELYNAEINANGFPVNLGDQLSKLGINGFAGESAVNFNITGQSDKSFSSAGRVVINKPSIVNPNGTIAEAIDMAVKQAGNVNLGLKYVHNPDDKDDFSITSNLADLFARALRNTAEAYIRTASAEIEKALRQKIDQYIDGRFVSKEEVDLLLKTVRGDKTAMDQMKSTLDSKKDELERKLKSQASNAIQNALPGMPSLPRR